MQESKSTDKLIAITHILDNMIEKLPKEKIEKIKTMEIVWKTVDEEGYRTEHPLPELKLSFHQ
jgi:hypothetical protein